MRGRVEIIVGRVRAFEFCAAMRIVAPGRRRLSALSVDALNGRHFGENAVAGMSGGSQSQPRNSASVWRVLAGVFLAGHFAAFVEPPGRAGRPCEMTADVF